MIAAVLSLSLQLVLAAEPVEQTIRVSPGTQQVIKIPGLTRVALADPTVADVNVTGAGELLVLGKRQGRTSMTLWVAGQKGILTRTIAVDDGKFAELEALCREKVNPSIKFLTAADKVVVEGTLDSMEEYRRLKVIVGDDARIKLMVRLNPRLLPAIANAINEALKKAGLSSAKAVVMGQKIVLEGSVADAEENKRAQLIADSYYQDLAGR